MRINSQKEITLRTSFGHYFLVGGHSNSFQRLFLRIATLNNFNNFITEEQILWYNYLYENTMFTNKQDTIGKEKKILEKQEKR